jgi:hypothetical protein
MTLPAGFIAKTRQTDCIVWVGSTNNLGYGIVQVAPGELGLAHRVAYEDANGPIPEGMVIDHLCRVRNCVNPAHLEAVTSGENTRRGKRARSLGVGETCSNGHLAESEADVYYRRNGTTECMECRRIGKRANRRGQGRPTQTRRAERVAADLERANA